MRLKSIWGLLGLLGWCGSALAVDKGFSKALGHIEIRSTGSEGAALGWTLAALFFLIVAGPIATHIYQQRRRAPHARAKAPDLKKQAQQLGFKLREIRVLKQLAGHLQGRVDLGSAAGRALFARDIERRMRRKRRELELLGRLRERLGVVAEYKARATARVEADLAVWLVRKSARAGDLDVAVEQAGATLADLGEGGAALRTPLALRQGDVVEWWSADTEIWIPPTTAVVVQVAGGTAHLEFVDPPVGELRRAMGELERELDGVPAA